MTTTEKARAAWRRLSRRDSSMANRHLLLSVPAHLAVVLVAIVTGQLVYAHLLATRHAELRATIGGTDALCEVLVRSQLASGPDGSAETCLANMRHALNLEDTLTAAEQTARFRAWIQGLQLDRTEDEDLTLEDTDGTRWALLHKAILQRETLRQQLELRTPPKLPSVVFLAELAAGLNALSDAGNSCGATRPEQLVAAHASVLAPILAGEPAFEWNTRNVRALADEYRARATEQRRDSENGNCVERIAGVVPHEAPSDWKRFGFMLRGSSRIPDSTVLQALFRGFGVLEEGGWTKVLVDPTQQPVDPERGETETRLPDESNPETDVSDPQPATAPADAMTPASSGTDVTPERLAQQRAVSDFMLNLMSELRAAPGVRSAQFGVTLWRGGEQLSMIIVAIWAVLLIALRAMRSLGSWRAMDKLRSVLTVGADAFAAEDVSKRAKRDGATDATKLEQDRLLSAARVLHLEQKVIPALPEGSLKYVAKTTQQMAVAGVSDASALRAVTQTEADAIYNSGWLIRLLLTMLPAIGFLGTVLGIMSALAEVDAISRVPPGPQQAVEVSFVAGTLGLAFATTAIALFAGLVLRYLHESLSAFETRMVTEQEALLTPLVDPTLWHDTV